MAGYYDSSLLLGAILGQVDPSSCSEAWDVEPIRVSSVLARVECVIGIRRLAAGMGKRAGAAWASSRLAAVDTYLDGLVIKPLDETIEQMVRQDKRLSACRALDAVHLATAQYFQPHLPEPLRICSLDKRLREVAKTLGFEVRPHVLPGEASAG